MCRQLFHDGPEKSVIERVIQQTIRRDAHRSFAVLLTALVAFAVATPIGAQDSNGAAPAQKSGDAGAHGVYKVGGDVSAPVLIRSVKPEYPENAGDTSVSGPVQVTLWVDVNGNPSHVRVTHGLGMGLDQKAVEAVRQYKYKPGTKDGKPVMVELNIEVNFQAH
jgi:periplasmic protein TonB